MSAVFENSTVVDAPMLISTTDWSQRFGDSTDVWAAALANPDVETTTVEATLASLETEYPQVAFENQADFKESIESQIDQLLVVINAMLVFGIGVVSALPDSFVSTLAFPVGRIAISHA